MKIYGNNIIGNSSSREGDIKFYAFNPADGKQLLPGFYEASAEEINRAIDKARNAFVVYRKKTGEEKAAFIEAIADEIMKLGSLLIERASKESGLSKTRLINERGRTIKQIKMFANLICEGSWVNARIDYFDKYEEVKKPDIRSMELPLGPVGVFGSSNFPLAFSVAGGDTISAFAAGCPVVFKAHPAHPGTCELVGLAIQKAAENFNMPDGVFSLLQGKSTRVGMAVVKHPLIKAIGFTGSLGGGRALFNEANKRPEPIPVYAEMGSVNPVFILPGILKSRSDKIVQNLISSVTLGVGQFCTNPGLVFLGNTSDDRMFVKKLVDKISGYPSGIMLTRPIADNYQRGIKRHSTIEGVNLEASGVKQENSECLGTPYVFSVNSRSFLQQEGIDSEIFGPTTTTVLTKDKEELFKAANELKGQLTATIYGTEKDLEEYKSLINILEQKVGRLLINNMPTGVEVCQAIVHGGPYPATTDSRMTSVGTRSIYRFTRPVCYQNFPESLLPDELKNSNPLNLGRLVNGRYYDGKI